MGIGLDRIRLFFDALFWIFVVSYFWLCDFLSDCSLYFLENKLIVIDWLHAQSERSARNRCARI